MKDERMKITRRELELQILNDESLYLWFDRSRLTLSRFIREYGDIVKDILRKRYPDLYQ